MITIYSLALPAMNIVIVPRLIATTGKCETTVTQVKAVMLVTQQAGKMEFSLGRQSLRLRKT